MTNEDIDWCDLIVYADATIKEATHLKFNNAKLGAMENMKRSVVLDCTGGQESTRGGWIERAEEKLKSYLV